MLESNFMKMIVDTPLLRSVNLCCICKHVHCARDVEELV